MWRPKNKLQKINYCCPARVLNQKLVHDTVQIQNDADVEQKINRWKSTQLLNPSVQREDLTTTIELFVQTKNLRSATPRISSRLREYYLHSAKQHQHFPKLVMLSLLSCLCCISISCIVSFTFN